jgi:cytochrome c
MPRKLNMPWTILTALVVPMLAHAAGQATPDEAKAMAIKAAEYLKSVGPAQAFPAFGAQEGPWRDRDLYVVVMNDAGVLLVNSTNPGLVGKSLLDLKDVDGKAFEREIVATQDTGWVRFKWQNPLTKAVEPKTQFEVRVGEYLVGVGAFTQ